MLLYRCVDIHITAPFHCSIVFLPISFTLNLALCEIISRGRPLLASCVPYYSRTFHNDYPGEKIKTPRANRRARAARIDVVPFRRFGPASDKLDAQGDTVKARRVTLAHDFYLASRRGWRHLETKFWNDDPFGKIDLCSMRKIIRM